MTKPWIRPLRFAVVGLLIGLAIHILLLPRPERWEKLPASPSPVTGLLKICEGTIYVETAGGGAFRLARSNHEEWSPAEADAPCAPWGGSPTEVKSCDFSSEPFAAATHPPEDIQTCLQGFTQYVEGYRSEAYVLDSAKNVWRWHFSYYAGVSGQAPIVESIVIAAPLFCCPVTGLLVALLSFFVQRSAAKTRH